MLSSRSYTVISRQTDLPALKASMQAATVLHMSLQLYCALPAPSLCKRVYVMHVGSNGKHNCQQTSALPVSTSNQLLC
jgi:hypothetical protein